MSALNSNPSVLLISPGNQNIKASQIDGFVVNPGVQTQDLSVKTCDAMWAEQMTQGKYENFASFMARNCLNKQKYVDEKGIVHPAGSLSVPISNKTLENSAYIYPQAPYPAPIPLMSHGYNTSALMQARANAVRNDGTLQANAGMYSRAKSSVKNSLMMGL